MRYLVTGGSGFLGRRLLERLGRQGEVLGTFCSRPVPAVPLVALDITEPSQVEDLLSGGNFDVCVHTAANRDLEACESDVAAAIRLNVEGTRHVAEACRRAGTRLVYICTDHVFDGRPRTAYTERDEPRPIQVYGFTKLAGEYHALRTAGALSVRVPVLHGVSAAEEKASFSVQALRRLQAGQRFAADDTVVRYPVLVDEAAEVVAALVAREVEGIVHFSGEQGVTKYRWARLIAETFGLDPALVVARPQGGRAARPRNNCLTSSRLPELGMAPPSSITDAVLRLRRSWSAA